MIIQIINKNTILVRNIPNKDQLDINWITSGSQLDLNWISTGSKLDLGHEAGPGHEASHVIWHHDHDPLHDRSKSSMGESGPTPQTEELGLH